MKFVLLIVVFIGVAGALQLTPVENNGIYKLNSQDDGAYIYADEGGVVKTGESSGQKGQKWTFKETGTKDVYTITPLANENNGVSSQQWQLIQVGHGKRLLRNTQTKLCIQNLGRGRPVQERECDRGNGKQRWYVSTTSA